MDARFQMVDLLPCPKFGNSRSRRCVLEIKILDPKAIGPLTSNLEAFQSVGKPKREDDGFIDEQIGDHLGVGFDKPFTSWPDRKMRKNGPRKLLPEFLHTTLRLIEIADEGERAPPVFCRPPHEMLIGRGANSNGKEPSITQPCRNFLEEFGFISHVTVRDENHLADA